MKLKLLVISMFIYVCQLSVVAQEPRPDWVRNTPFPPVGANYIFVYGMGIGITEPDAEFSAWKNALYKALNESGLVGVETQSKTLDQVFSMEDLKTKLPENLLQRRFVCQTLPILFSEKEIKVYILIQVQRDGRQSANFYSHDLNFVTCETSDFLQELKEYNKGETDKRKIERENAKKITGEYALFAKGKHVSRAGYKLEENNVRTFFANSKSYRLYNSGINLYKTTKILCWTGFYGVNFIGLLVLAGGLDKPGLYVLGGGTAVGIIGVICNITGKNKISKAVELYNNGRQHSSLPIELNFGLTQDGLGIVLNF